MKLSRMLLALLIAGVLAGVAYVRQAAEPSGARMADAADKLLAGLTAEQKTKASYAFDDHERFNWYFTPRQDAQKRSTRKGLPLEEMTDAQKDAARALLKAGTSSDGYSKASTIMSLEAILKDLEDGRMVRNPEWYFFTIFGTPSKTGKWGWRVEGHHLSLNFTIDGGNVVAASPAFFGANPATVKQGPRQGTRTLPEADDLARELFKALDEEQRKTAFQEKQFPEIGEHTRAPDVGEAKGIAYAKLDSKQQQLLLKLVKAYAARMPEDIAAAEMAGVERGGLDNIHFAFAGDTEPGKPHTYRIQGPTFVIEFLNIQADSARNPANHIHSAWRSLKNDFGAAN
jgi:hypothetical protein